MKYKNFIFEKYQLDKPKNEIRFYYSLDGKVNFVDRLKLGSKPTWNKVNSELLQAALFNLHLVLGISYWKTYCPRKMIIKSGFLTRKQAAFWDKLYIKGLGEFFYKNKIDWRGLINFPASPGAKGSPVKYQSSDKILISFGGGKDSIVTAELLKKYKKDFTLFNLRDSRIQAAVAKIIGKTRIIIDREIDERLFKLNKAGAYNGHIPISAIYSLTALLAAAIYDYKYIIFSNERSANYGNIKYLGQTINHQYSKTYEFESDLSDYIHKFITPEIKYFSLLRQWSELKIIKAFSYYKKYFKAFSSCNKNFRLTEKTSQNWCGRCAKCAFSFSQLAAFLPKAQVIKIFQKNLYADETLLDLYLELLGEKNFKPFDCVGTPAEVKLAMYLCHEKGEFKNDFMIKYFVANILPKIKNTDKLYKEVMSSRGRNNLPPEFRKIVK